MVEFAAYVGWDWGRQSHAVDVEGVDGRWQRAVAADPEVVGRFIADLRERYRGAPVAVCIERGRSAVMHTLMAHEFIHLFPLNPKATHNYAKTRRPSGASSDASDARMIRELVQRHPGQYACWRPGDALTRELDLLVQWRRKFVNLSTASAQQLEDTLLQYFPQALEWGGEIKSPMMAAFLTKWPTLEAVQRAKPETIRRFYRGAGSRSEEKISNRLAQIATATPLVRDRAVVEAFSAIAVELVAQLRAFETSVANMDKKIDALWQSHPDRLVFESLPGAGAVMAPRLGVAFGTDRSRWNSASAMQRFSGIAPVIEQSGKYRKVRARWQCPKFVRQTFHEFAKSSINFSIWAKTYYERAIARGKGRNCAIRSLAFLWIRIIFRCWQTGTPYDEARYLESLRRSRSPLAC